VIKDAMTKRLRTSQKQAAIPNAGMVLKRKSGYDVAPMNRAKLPRLEDSGGMELDDDKKERAPGDMLD
jgi:hypothetical protein